ncbi:hypothetical protein AB0F91_44525 [Amycolatopsis sp. NPDC023774]|uniref:hypothetical protein n=1 Tax=Amycolatopsis sp. NPDC023774 TaxID=3155015 RepID=UPI0034000F60
MAVTAGVVELLLAAGSVILPIGVAFFIAVGVEPVTAWLARRIPRPLAAASPVRADGLVCRANPWVT